MNHVHGEGAKEFLEAQTHIYRHIFNYISSMSLKCAVQLGIPDIIHSHNQPITLPELVTALQIPPLKANCVHRLMRILVHSGFFVKTEERYDLTPSSRFLIKGQITNLSPFVLGMLDPGIVSSWHSLGDWLKGNETTPFETAHGMSFWDSLKQNHDFNNLFNQAMASDSQLANLVIKDCKPVFEGLSSLVDVGGGNGATAKIISEAFPNLKCTVLDLPHVIANKFSESKNLSFVGGDMFHSIPSADAILFKLVMHAFSDEDCVKILKRCREAVSSREERSGKVIIIDIVVNEKEEHELTEAKLFFDLLMMVVVTGRERTEKEWERLFLEAGFSHYKITPLFGVRSLVEVYP